jgi:prepilin-type N-terminal cleavage/methylation domain-containing protein
MLHRTGSAPRRGFTLVELLIVIAIILVLAGLLLAAFSTARQSARTLQTTHEIRDLDKAIAEFKTKFGFVPPSHVVERATDGNFYVRQFVVPTRTDQPEYLVFRKMWDRWDPANQTYGAIPGVLPADGVTINPAIPYYPARAGETLDNNQAMVYFLAGPTNQGWSNGGPIAPTGNTKINAFYEFQQGEQLVPFGAGAPRFHDPYGIPYAYFSGNTQNDQFDARAHFPWNTTQTATFQRGATTVTYPVAPLTYDPATDTTATKTVHPFRSPGGKWLNAGRWQIVSAGRDKQFGFGSPIVGATPVIVDFMPGVGDYELKAKGMDDLSNFASGNLGVGQ